MFWVIFIVEIIKSYDVILHNHVVTMCTYMPLPGKHDTFLSWFFFGDKEISFDVQYKSDSHTHIFVVRFLDSR